MKITLGFSPCPNDTFIFGALVNGLIDTQGLEFEPVLADVQELNNWAAASKLDVTKLSFYAYCQLDNAYTLLDSGSALGLGVGPLLISRKGHSFPVNQPLPPDVKVALPGEQTTAHFLFDYFQKFPVKKSFMIFNQIEEAVLDGRADAGVIIHENRFTYLEKGLEKIIDLGDFWERSTQRPIPLGGIVARSNFDISLLSLINSLIRQSIEFAYQYPERIWPYILSHAQEMEDEVIRKHIQLYVNDFTLDLGKEGHEAILRMKSVINQK
ncbi:MAG: 1,4-dihydroxy-6-naphthoate synthase [Bacteroidia bacterium]|nr:1,4-dihydroxy-6-naphthoate synthase [Bacteroidia bacterium]